MLEADFLEGVLRRIKAQRRPSSGSGQQIAIHRNYGYPTPATKTCRWDMGGEKLSA